MGILFIVFGVIFTSLGITLFCLVSNKKSYQKVFEQSKKRDIKNVILLSTIVDIQAEQIKELSEKVENLERKLK